jgi:hypothetical protein
MENKSLEQLIQRELSKLPERQAPDTLIPRVLARIEARARRHWWQRPWTQWPIGLQVVSVPLLLASAAALVVGSSAVWRLYAAQLSFQSLSDGLGTVSDAWDILETLGNALLVLTRGVGQEWVLMALLVPFVMYLACVGLGTLCYRTAFYRR